MTRPRSCSNGRSHFRRQNLGPDHANSVVILNQLALVYADRTKYSEAEALYLRSIAIHERKTPDENLDLAETAEQYADLLQRMKRPDDANRWHAPRPDNPRQSRRPGRPKPGPDRLEKDFRGFK